MKKYSNEELKEIKKNLSSGVKYTGVKNNLGSGVIYTDGKYVHFKLYGSSAIKNTIKDLKWLLETIFNEYDFITECQWSDYHINYKPINENYSCVDLSRSHPNVCGI